MPTYPIQLKRNGTAAATPSSLLHGEVALNYADGKLFWKDASNVIQSFTFQAYAPTSHSHGNITNAGAIGSTANLPIITTTSGVLTTGSFGTSAATFCEGNDSRLSDTRTPTDGSVTTAKIANDAVTYAKLQNVSATDRLLGRSSAGSGDVEEITCTAFGRSLIDDADAAAARSTLSVQPTASPAFTGTFACGDTVNIGTASATNTIINVGNGATGNRFALIDIIGDTTYTDYGLRIGRDNNGANGQSIIHHRGTGEIAIVAIDAGSVQLGTSSTARLTISSAGVSTFSGQLLVTTGSASACGVAFSGDPDTGIAQLSAAGANTLSICTNSEEAVRVNASQNVGIGVSPSYRLHLSGNYSGVSNIGVYVNNSGGASTRIALQDTATTFSPNFGSVGNAITFDLVGTERLRIDADGNVRVNGAAAATSAVGAIHIKNGTAPTASILDGVVLFAADVSSSSELRVRDEAGNTTTLSPHAFPLIPDGPSEPMAWAYYSERDGRRINVDMLRVVRLMEQLTGEKLVYED